MRGGDPELDAQAIKWFEQACDGGDMMGCGNLGVMCMLGRGTQPDRVRALALLEKACGGGYGRACADLGKITRIGEAVTRDDRRATELYQRACDLGDSLGCLLLAEACGEGLGVSADKGKSIALYEKACDGENANACEVLGFLIFKGYAAGDDFRAGNLFKKACDLDAAGRPYSCAETYLRGIGVPKDRARAISLFRSACDQSKWESACKRAKELEQERTGASPQ
jgi:hypothetical protein